MSKGQDEKLYENVVQSQSDRANETLEPTLQQRREEIFKYVLFGKPQSIQDIVEYFKNNLSDKYPGCKNWVYKSKQPQISDDIRKLYIKPVGRGKGFELQPKAKERANNFEVASILALARTTPKDIVSAYDYPLILTIEGYCQALANALKKMFKNDIAAIICLEPIIVIYCPTEISRGIISDYLNDLLFFDNPPIE